MSATGQLLAFPQRHQEPYIDLRAVREQFGYSERWWRYQLTDPDFPKHRYGAHWRFLRSEVERYLHERERHAS